MGKSSRAVTYPSTGLSVSVQGRAKVWYLASTDNATISWYALDVEIDSRAREAVEYALMEAGALGTETNDPVRPTLPGDTSTMPNAAFADKQSTLNVTAYFDQPPDRERVRTELAKAFHIYDLTSSSVDKMDVRRVPNEDWLAEWKRNWRPVEVGSFVIAPPWSDGAFPDDRIVIRIEPGMAFGTGTHETTRLCLSAMEKYYQGGSFLDVGTGTGILAIAAAKLFPTAEINACDTDATAVQIAAENARLNHSSDTIHFRVGSVDESTPSADFVCANLTADVINRLLPLLRDVTCGRLLLSGILDSQVEQVLTALTKCGLAQPIETFIDGEWAALVI